MTLKERVIVEVYTGTCMVVGEECKELYKYMESITGRPVFTHELASKEIQEELKEKSKDDFVNLCKPPKTNADRIRVMSDEELAEFFCGRFTKWNRECDKDKFSDVIFTRDERFLNWLKSEAKE